MDLCLYHKNCPDGWASAYIAQKKWPGIECIGCLHGQIPPKVFGRHVLVTDFSWPRPTMDTMKAEAGSLTVIDHHITAMDALQDFPGAVFDLKHSGAWLTWLYCFPLEPVPWWVNYVEDRDLWNWKLPMSKEINGFIMTLPHTPDAWVRLEGTLQDEAVQYGTGIRMQIDHYVDKVIELHQHGYFHGYSCAMVNCAYPNISDVGHRLRAYADVALLYFTREDGMMQFSVYGQNHLDSSELAKLHGGGGHKGAAGFQLPLAEGRRVVDAVLRGE